MSDQNIVELEISSLTLDAGTQVRAALDPEAVDRYTNDVDELPPIKVTTDETTWWPTDGMHRIQAHIRAGRTTIRAAVTAGTLRDARLAAIGANVNHGVHLTNADKRRAVELLLDDPEWRNWSAKDIGKRLKMSEHVVGDIKKQRAAHGGQDDVDDDEPQIVAYQRNGKRQQMRVPKPASISPPAAAAQIQIDPSRPWAAFEGKMQDAISIGRQFAQALRDAIDYDPATRQVRERWAKYCSFANTIGSVNGLIRELEGMIPCALTDKLEHGYANKKTLEIMAGVAIKVA